MARFLHTCVRAGTRAAGFKVRFLWVCNVQRCSLVACCVSCASQRALMMGEGSWTPGTPKINSTPPSAHQKPSEPAASKVLFDHALKSGSFPEGPPHIDSHKKIRPWYIVLRCNGRHCVIDLYWIQRNNARSQCKKGDRDHGSFNPSIVSLHTCGYSHNDFVANRKLFPAAPVCSITAAVLLFATLSWLLAFIVWLLSLKFSRNGRSCFGLDNRCAQGGVGGSRRSPPLLTSTPASLPHRQKLLSQSFFSDPPNGGRPAPPPLNKTLDRPEGAPSTVMYKLHQNTCFCETWCY